MNFRVFSRRRVIIYANITIIPRIYLLFSTIVLQIRSIALRCCSNVFLFVQNRANNTLVLP